MANWTTETPRTTTWTEEDKDVAEHPALWNRFDWNDGTRWNKAGVTYWTPAYAEPTTWTVEEPDAS